MFVGSGEIGGVVVGVVSVVAPQAGKAISAMTSRTNPILGQIRLFSVASVPDNVCWKHYAAGLMTRPTNIMLPVAISRIRKRKGRSTVT